MLRGRANPQNLRWINAVSACLAYIPILHARIARLRQAANKPSDSLKTLVQWSSEVRRVRNSTAPQLMRRLLVAIMSMTKPPQLYVNRQGKVSQRDASEALLRFVGSVQDTHTLILARVTRMTRSQCGTCPDSFTRADTPAIFSHIQPNTTIQAALPDTYSETLLPDFHHDSSACKGSTGTLSNTLSVEGDLLLVYMEHSISDLHGNTGTLQSVAVYPNTRQKFTQIPDKSIQIPNTQIPDKSAQRPNTQVPDTSSRRCCVYA